MSVVGEGVGGEGGDGGTGESVLRQVIRQVTVVSPYPQVTVVSPYPQDTDPAQRGALSERLKKS